jgi:hypothetical protein
MFGRERERERERERKVGWFGLSTFLVGWHSSVVNVELIVVLMV